MTVRTSPNRKGTAAEKIKKNLREKQPSLPASSCTRWYITQSISGVIKVNFSL